MSGRGDARRLVHVLPDVTFVAQDGAPGMDPHSNADRPARQAIDRALGRPDGARRVGKREEERVALCVDLDATLAGTRLAQDASVLGERVAVPLPTKLVQQPGGALDVREQERHGARWEVRPGQCSVRHSHILYPRPAPLDGYPW